MPIQSGLDQVGAEAVLSNPRLRARAERIMDALFADVEYVMEFGSDAQRLSLQKSVIPSILKQVQTAQQNAELEQLRKDHEEIRQWMSGLGVAPPAPAAE